MLAVLPMYDWPEIWAQNDARWAKMRDALRGEGIDAPDNLDRTVGYNESWTRDDLVLGEACGLPYIEELHDKVELIGTWDLDLKNCAPGEYNSHIIVHADSDLGMEDLPAKPFAFNTPCSQSGLGTLRTLGLSGGTGIETGGHRASVQMVASGKAEFAAIDANSWKLALKYEPSTQLVRVISSTKPTPAPAVIAAKGADVAAYRRALTDIIPVSVNDYRSLL